MATARARRRARAADIQRSYGERAAPHVRDICDRNVGGSRVGALLSHAQTQFQMMIRTRMIIRCSPGFYLATAATQLFQFLVVPEKTLISISPLMPGMMPVEVYCQ